MIKRLPKSLRPEEFIEFIRHIPKHNKAFLTAFLLAYGSGMRISEVKNLQPQNVRDNDIFIEAGKGDKDRIVPKPKGWKEYMIKELPIKKSIRTLQRAFKKYAKLANLDPKYTFHSLRHSFGTRLTESGVPINQVQLLMGHSDISTTGIYTKARPMDALKSYENMF